MNIRTHICRDEPERGASNHRKAKRHRERYWANPEKYRAIALASYYRHIEKNRAAARARMRKTT